MSVDWVTIFIVCVAIALVLGFIFAQWLQEKGKNSEWSEIEKVRRAQEALNAKKARVTETNNAIHEVNKVIEEINADIASDGPDGPNRTDSGSVPGSTDTD
jgi:peptidoglycan hydrolase CwlO-like protein